MELENIITLIKTVSESNLTSFQYTQGDCSLSFEINRNTDSGVNIAGKPAEVIVTTQPVNDEIDNSNKLIITSPMVGTFYAAKSEDSDPFITVGETVKKGQVIGIVEAMKLMNEIESEYDGVVEEILVKNKDMVEYGQNLVRIKPN